VIVENVELVPFPPVPPPLAEAPPPPTVIVIGLVGTAIFVPPGNEVR
jgi:hypothetical protein